MELHERLVSMYKHALEVERDEAFNHVRLMRPVSLMRLFGEQIA